MFKFFLSVIGGIILTTRLCALAGTTPELVAIHCVEPRNDGRMVYGPYVLEYWGTTESPLLYQDGSPVPIESKTILFVPEAGGFYDSFRPGIIARFWVGGTEEETRAFYDALTRGIPLAESGVAVTTVTPGDTGSCPAQ